MKHEGLEETFEEEVAVDIMEDEADKVHLVKNVIDFLIGQNLMVEQQDGSYFFTQAAEMSGDEGSSAERMRNKRARDKPSQSDEETSHDDGLSQSDENSSQRYQIQNNNNNRITSTDIAIARAISVEEQKTETASVDSASADHCAASAAADAAAPHSADLFLREQLLDIRHKHEIDMTWQGIDAFLDEMQKSKWMLYNKPVTKEGIVKALRGWAKYHDEYQLSADIKLERSIVKVLKKYLGDEKTNKFLEGDSIDYQMELLQKCPVEAFTEEMLEYMEDTWHLIPQ